MMYNTGTQSPPAPQKRGKQNSKQENQRKIVRLKKQNKTKSTQKHKTMECISCWPTTFCFFFLFIFSSFLKEQEHEIGDNEGGEDLGGWGNRRIQSKYIENIFNKN